MAGATVLKLPMGPMDNNVYVLKSSDGLWAAVIDASDEPDAIVAACQPAHVLYLLITHGDADHVGALAQLKRLLPSAKVAIHPADATLLTVPADLELEDGMRLPLGDTEIAVWHTPGHTAGSVCFFADGILLSGDTLFPGGPGNTRRPGGDFAAIIDALSSKLFTLPDSTIVHPGHGDSTSIGKERPDLEQWRLRGW